MLEAQFGFSAEIIVANPARDDSLIPEKIRHIRKVCRCTAKLAALRENIPEQFAQSDCRKLFHGRHAFLRQYSAFAQFFGRLSSELTPWDPKCYRHIEPN